MNIKRKIYILYKLYNLTFDQYVKMLSDQEYKCAICKTELFAGKDTHVDHSHSTGKVREILCQNCNKALGLVNDNVSILEGMIKYLKKHS